MTKAPVHLVSDLRFRGHDPGSWHPECPARLAAVEERLATAGLLAQMRPVAPRPASPDELLRVHTAEHVHAILALRGRATEIDPDTATSEGSVEAAELAAGGSAELVDAVLGEGGAGLALVRPPGHHATPNRAMGFCLWNNVAVAAAHALEARGLDRVMIIDWDVHHGNGTQDAFYGDHRVLYVSTHQRGHFPGTGWINELGTGAAVGSTVNVPLPGGTVDGDILGVFRHLVRPLAEHFEPQLVLVSAGFDGHVEDPLADWCLTTRGYGQLAAAVAGLAHDVCQGRWAAFLEGGYRLDALAASVEEVVRVMAGAPATAAAATVMQPACRDAVERLQRTLGEIGVL